ncbi:MAG: thymidylate synthase [Candidatus Thorarchaeota archaeon]|nr:thymidylate synthase [Candidatus Thorarchaeota archaeon]
MDPPSPSMIENPQDYMGRLNLTQCDLLLLVALHHDLLASVDLLIEATGAKAVIVPIEDPTWVPPGLRAQAKEALDSMGIESAFPKPFCTLEPGAGRLIDEFIARFRIGRPVHYVDMKGDVISEVGPLRSAPCGCTWYVSQKVRGKSIRNTDELFDTIAKAHHSYPCTASMAKDREVGDALLHVAGYNARYAVCEAVGIEDCRTTIEKD